MSDLLPSNAAHWHLVLNHLPVVGSFAALLLLGWAWIKNTDDLKRVALASLVVVAAVAIPAFLTGEPSERHLKGLQGVSSRWMSNHEDLAEISLWVTVAVGALALAALIAFRKVNSLPRWVVGVLLAACLVVCGFMARTANYGGKIRHSEIRTYSTAPAEPDAEE
jgi:glucan phosphoethanolaminetransferase (alkaline phosphatase superfamily)